MSARISNDVVAKPYLVNDFSITVGTVNGSGSQTSNLTILRAIFKMGIPVSGKNLFPSNIQGLPTWYTIRVNKDGYLARKEEQDIIIAMNPSTFSKDLADLAPGGVFLYPDNIKMPINRSDISAYSMPVRTLVRESGAPSSLRDYVANMVYVGVLAQLINIKMENIKQALTFHFKSKEKPIELNYNIISAAAKWAEEHLGKTDQNVLEPMEKTDGYIMADGNTAGAIGSIYGGVHFVSWYPITPGSSLPEAVIQYLPMLRKDPVTGKNTYAVIQAEDELSAIGMCIGAGWTGLRAMTSTSGPGISLMAEYAGLAYLAEVPLVIWDVQRMGPSTGLPTRTSQGDINLVYFLGHGDTKHVVLLPGSVSECFEFGWRAFDLAEELQTLVFVLSDLDLAMNQWMTEPFEYPDEPINRGKILWEDGIDEFEGIWGRYLDIDDDGIPYRTVPGNRNPKSSYFTRGTGHDEFANYSEDAEVWTRNMARLSRKFETARKIVPKPEIDIMADAEVGIIAFGSTHNAISEARIFLNENGVSTDYLRLRALPFTEETIDFVKSHRRVYVIEMNRDGQLHQLLTIETPELAGSIKSIKRNNGLPLTAKWIKKEIITLETS